MRKCLPHTRGHVSHITVYSALLVNNNAHRRHLIFFSSFLSHFSTTGLWVIMDRVLFLLPRDLAFQPSARQTQHPLQSPLPKVEFTGVSHKPIDFQQTRTVNLFQAGFTAHFLLRLRCMCHLYLEVIELDGVGQINNTPSTD